MTRVPADHEGFNCGWFFWPYTLRHWSPSSHQAHRWTRRVLRHQRAMAVRTL